MEATSGNWTGTLAENELGHADHSKMRTAFAVLIAERSAVMVARMAGQIDEQEYADKVSCIQSMMADAWDEFIADQPSIEWEAA